ncbi:hypothetical protein NC651_001951 [Populus alba x Populus x berolinensis]|nr:hypothetical protein NC651_001951 [Populus alba x Populus x berolinensis]
MGGSCKMGHHCMPINNTRDHPGMIQVFSGHNEGHDVKGNELPRLVYMSREKRDLIFKNADAIKGMPLMKYLKQNLCL